MSFLRQVPEFIRGIELASSGKWSRALSDFDRTRDILTHSPRDFAIASLYSATCLYYSGDTRSAHNGFMKFTHAPESMIAIMANTFAFSTFPIDELDTAAQRDKPHGDNVLEENNALIYDAMNRVNMLPSANPDGRSVEEELSIVNKALKAGESLAKRPSPEYDIIAKWYIGRSLLLRGKLFEFNGNAVMAEGMYNAALEQARNHSPVFTPRLTVLEAMSTNALGGLLLKWEKRESEGRALKEANVWLTPELESSFNQRNIVEPTLDQLATLEVNS